jgi:hypothetical protein
MQTENRPPTKAELEDLLSKLATPVQPEPDQSEFTNNPVPPAKIKEIFEKASVPVEAEPEITPHKPPTVEEFKRSLLQVFGVK